MEMQNQVTDRIEKKLQELSYFNRAITYTKPGFAAIQMEFKDYTPAKLVPELFYQLRKKLGDLKAELPSGIIGPSINDEFGDVDSVLTMITGDGADYAQLKRVAEDFKRVLLKVPDVTKVNVYGAQEERIHVEFSHAKLATLGIPVQAIFDAIARQNAVLPAGTFETGAQRIPLRVTGALDGAEAVAAIPVEANGRSMRLGDIAEVSRGYKDPSDFLIRQNGKPALGERIIVAGRVVVEAELDTGNVARRLRREIHDLYGYPSEVHVLRSGGIRKGARYIVRVVKDGEALARQTGLLDQRGRPVRGLPAMVVGGSVADAEAAWRGAFLAHGSLTEPGRSSALEVSCPGPEAALALVGAARRLGVAAKAREVRGADRVVIRDGEAIGDLLTRMGAQDTRLEWEERRMRREVRATANRLANFDDANLRRSARAAVAAAARVERALEILGDEVPDHLIAAGRLRVTHRQASLEELGKLADPPMTKDAVAGRIRRLLSMADKKARVEGIPDTESAVTTDLLDDE